MHDRDAEAHRSRVVFLHLTKEAPMATIPKVVGLLSCGVLLCLGLSSTAQARTAASVTDHMNVGQSDRGDKMRDPMKGAWSKGGWTIRGEVLRIQGHNLFVKGGNGKQVRLHTD